MNSVPERWVPEDRQSKDEQARSTQLARKLLKNQSLTLTYALRSIHPHSSIHAIRVSSQSGYIFPNRVLSSHAGRDRDISPYRRISPKVSSMENLHQYISRMIGE